MQEVDTIDMAAMTLIAVALKALKDSGYNDTSDRSR